MKVNTESAKQNCKLLSFQLFMTLAFVYIICQTIYMNADVVQNGRPSLIYLTFLFAFLV